MEVYIYDRLEVGVSVSDYAPPPFLFHTLKKEGDKKASTLIKGIKKERASFGSYLCAKESFSE